MTKILDVNNLLDAGTEVLTDKQFAAHLRRLERATEKLAGALAKKLQLECSDVSYQQGMGGLCAAFHPTFDGQECPSVIHDGDPGGDFD